MRENVGITKEKPMSLKRAGKKENKLVFKIVTPKNMVTISDLKDIDELVMVEVIDFKSGSRIGKFKLSVAKLKFSL